MKRVKIRETGPLALEMSVRKTVKKKRKTVTERLAIEDPAYPRTDESRILFQSFGTMHLVAPYLPREIDTDFPIADQVALLIDEMYESCGERAPGYVGKVGQGDIVQARFGGQQSDERAIVSYSAGKDSLWNMMWAREKYGPSNVMAVHIGGLNTANASGERKFAFRQAERLEFSHFRTVELKSSARCTKNGFEVMRSRDIFMTGILVPIARRFAAGTIITEGFAETLDSEPFTGQEATMEKMNSALRRMGIPVKVAWQNLPEMDVIRELYERKPTWMPEVHNCFTIPCYKIGIKKSWKRRTPNWPLYDSQCGSCSKCRITRLAQLRFDREGMESVPSEEIHVFLKDTARYTINEWRLASKGKFNRMDMLNGSFRYHLSIALLEYDLKELNLDVVEKLMHYDELIPAA